jgi:Glyoxalase superfamily protein
MREIFIEAVAPVLAFRDLAMALLYYRDILGFEHMFVKHEPPEPPVYAIVQRGDVKVHLAPAGDGIEAGHGGAHFKVLGVELLHRELAKRGVRVVHRDFKQDGKQLRTFTIEDLDGNRLSFAERSRNAG